MRGEGVLTAESPGRERCGRVRKCSIVRELENALDFGVDVSRRLVWGGGDETAGRTGEGASGQEAFVEFVCVDVEAFPVLCRCCQSIVTRIHVGS